MIDDLKTPLILVIDDDAMMQFLVRESLESQNLRIIEAENGAEGLTQAVTFKPDLILLDVQMPVLDGFTACAQLRALPQARNIPVLMMTGLDDLASIERAYEVGATDFITKPLNFDLLKFRLFYMLRTKAVSDELRNNEAMLASAQRIARLGHWEFQPSAGFTRWSSHTNDALGMPPEASIATVTELLERVVASDRDAVAAAFADCLDTPSEEAVEYEVVDQNGQRRIIQQYLQRQPHPDGGISFIGTVQDITARRQAEQQIHDLAYYDRVTGLPNRALLEQRLAEILQGPLSGADGVVLLAVNIDHFSALQ